MLWLPQTVSMDKKWVWSRLRKHFYFIYTKLSKSFPQYTLKSGKRRADSNFSEALKQYSGTWQILKPNCQPHDVCVSRRFKISLNFLFQGVLKWFTFNILTCKMKSSNVTKWLDKIFFNLVLYVPLVPLISYENERWFPSAYSAMFLHLLIQNCHISGKVWKWKACFLWWEKFRRNRVYPVFCITEKNYTQN